MYKIDRNLLPTAEPVVVAKAFTLESLIGFLETKSPDETYDYSNTKGGCAGCVFAQYAAHQGYSADFSGYVAMLDDAGTYPSDPIPDVGSNHPYTFGAALTRARAALGAV